MSQTCCIKESYYNDFLGEKTVHWQSVYTYRQKTSCVFLAAAFEILNGS